LRKVRERFERDDLIVQISRFSATSRVLKAPGMGVVPKA
jgi:hypothetical protein